MLLRIFIFLLLLFLSPAVIAQDKVKEADALFAKKQYREALTIYKQELAKSPNNVDLILKTAKANFEAINYTDALDLYDRAIKVDSKCHVAYFEKGRLFNLIGAFKEAIDALSAAIKIKDEGDYYYWRGIVYQQMEDGDKAHSDYNSAMARGVKAPELYNNLAMILLVKGKEEEAFKYVNMAITGNPKDALALSARARIRLTMLDVDSACIDARTSFAMGYKEAVEIPDYICNSPYPIKMQYLGEMLLQTGKMQRAIEAFTKAIEANTDSGSVYHNRGYCYFKTNQYEKAEADYLKALTFTNANKWGLYDNLSLLYFEWVRFDKSIEYTNKRIEMRPTDPTPYIDRGIAQRKLKKYKEAEADFNKALSIDPRFFRAYGYRAFLYLETGKTQKALEDAQRSVDLEPTYSYGYVVLAQAKQKLGIKDFCTDYYKAAKLGWTEAEEAIKQFCK